MPYKLWIKILNDFVKYYKGQSLSSELCVEVDKVLTPICEKIERGELCKH